METLTKCFAVNDSGHLVGADHAEVMERWRAGDGPFWIHVDSTAGEARAAALLEAVTDDRAAMMEMLSSLTQPHFDVTTVGGQFSVALGNTTAASRRIDRLERRAADLQLRYDSHLQERMNRRLSRLTIISAIFLPLTLIAGIYGMNFDIMPELHHPLGYPIVLAAMVLVGIGMVWWFLARGWME